MTVNRSDFQRRFKAEPDSGDRFIGMDTDDGSGDPFVTDLAGLAAGLAPIIATAASGYQPLDSDLTAIAALSTTSYGRSLLTSADAAALRTTASAAPLADTTSIWLAPSDFAINAGSPSIASGLLIPSIALDPTSIEIITAGFRTPSSWVTADVTLWYYTASAVGNFVINPRIYLAASGESAAPSAEAGITSSITVAGSTAAIANTQACGTFTCRSNAVGSFWLQRNATSGSDTNAGDFSVLGVAITKAS